MSARRSNAFYRFLLRALPGEFRARHGDELAASFIDQLREARERRALSGAVGVWLAALGDLVAHAFRLRRRADGKGFGPRPHRPSRQTGRSGIVDRCGRELRLAVRSLWRSPGFSLVAVATLALGIGSSVALFGVLYSVVLRPLPYPEADRLVQLWGAVDGEATPFGNASLPDLDDWRAATTSLAALAGYRDDRLPLGGIDEPALVEIGVVTEDFFATLGVGAARGRVIGAADFTGGADRVAVISDAAWRTRFGAADVLGEPIRLGEKTYSVVGILGPRDHMLPSKQTEFWIGVEAGMQRGSRSLEAIGRLRPGTSRTSAQADLDAVTAALAARFPDSNAGRSVQVVALEEIVVGNQSRSLILLFGAAAAVLLIATANVVGVVRVRLIDRRDELSVRVALGASRFDLLAHLGSEALVLATTAGALGVIVAHAGVSAFLRLAPREIPRLAEVGIDGAALGFAVALTLFVALIVGGAPAARPQRLRHPAAPRSGGGHGWLVVVEVALCVVVLVASGLLLRSFDRLQRVDTGFDPEDVLSLRLELPGSRYESAAEVVAFHENVLDRVAALPRVTAVGGVTVLPFAGGNLRSSVAIDGVERDDLAAEFRSVSGDYFRTLNIELLAGRSVGAADTDATALVTTVNRALAERAWPGEQPLGRTITIFDRTWTVVGVVGDLRHVGFEVPPAPEMYVSFRQQPRRYLTHVLKVDGDPAAIIPAVRELVRDADSELPIGNLATMPELVWRSAAGPRFRTTLLGALAAVALTLAGVGVFGIASFAVSCRTREIGIRRALGARTGNVVSSVIGRGTAVVAIGAITGLALAAALAGFLRSLLFEVDPLDPMVFGGAALVIGAAALTGCLFPALRAAAVDPATAIGNNAERR